ncbi:MAG: acyltransferase [Bacteroidales bacterium]|nr:acyltransferase [Bacteroidales bacterium]
MTEWKGQTRGGLTGYKIFIAVLRYLGLPFAYLMLRFVALYFFLFNPASFRYIFYFYRKRLKYGLFRSVISVYRNYYTFGQVILDKTATMGGFDAKFTFDFDGEEHLRNIARDGKGGLFISAHVGNFEMAGHMLERLDATVNVIMLDAEHQKIKEYLSSFTQKSFHVIPIGTDNAHVYEISRALGNHEIVCMHGDRFLEGSKTLACDFLGEKALLPTGPFYLAMKFGVPVSFVFAMKEDTRHYHYYATPPRLYQQQATPSKRDEMLRTVISDYLAAMEEKVRKYPFQWFNYYDFWKAR